MNLEQTYKNPVIRGFCPDPSICRFDDRYYLVCSSFQYFPGIPIYESNDLINWTLIGHALTRQEQLPLHGADSSGGIYAPTIRCHNGRFYIVTTNVNGCGNFLIWTDDIYGEWSDIIPIDRDGIDPSLYFEDEHVYFMSNHNDSDGRASIMQCEICPQTGTILSEARCIWRGCGGRYLEGPHLYKRKDYYYLLAAEGGTEYGHMEVIARSRHPYGPFEVPPADSPDANPILTNRNLGGYPLQGTGHGDLIQDKFGNWWMVLLAFRQIGQYLTFHHLGRETCLVPVTFTEDGWLKAGVDKTVRLDMTFPAVFAKNSLLKDGFDQPSSLSTSVSSSNEIIEQRFIQQYDFHSDAVGKEWIWLRNPDLSNYQFHGNVLSLKGTSVTLDNSAISPSFLGIRQQEFDGHIHVKLSSSKGEAGITLYMNQEHHYDFALLHTQERCCLIKRRTIGDMQYIQQEVSLPIHTENVLLDISMNAETYTFHAEVHSNSDHSDYSNGTVWNDSDCKPIQFDFGTACTKYLSSETAGGFTGVMIGLYAMDTEESFAEFSNFTYSLY